MPLATCELIWIDPNNVDADGNDRPAACWHRCDGTADAKTPKARSGDELGATQRLWSLAIIGPCKCQVWRIYELLWINVVCTSVVPWNTPSVTTRLDLFFFFLFFFFWGCPILRTVMVLMFHIDPSRGIYDRWHFCNITCQSHWPSIDEQIWNECLWLV